MKIYLNEANESWIVDRFRDEWINYHPESTTNKIKESDLIWLIAPWVWKKIPKKNLKNKNVFCTIHHIDFEKFDNKERKNFFKRDKYVNVYHSISKKTTQQLRSLTDKEIITIPFWVNQNLFYENKDKSGLKQKYGINENTFIIGSFQRDTEGKDLISPKLSKGPDQFIEIVKHYYSQNKNLLVLLAGKRRNYILDQLNKFDIPSLYLEMVENEDLNELYNILDLYIVASRVEGGPQAIFECALSKTPIISTDVGIASEILDKRSLFDMSNFKVAEPEIEKAYKNVRRFEIPNGFNKFHEVFGSIN
tara:strand:+ start:16519 stop:17436 length:918 start_codon:yes stop_codon:yes gene_type:complete